MGKLFKREKRTDVIVNLETFGGPWDGALVQCYNAKPGLIVRLHDARYELRANPMGAYRFYYIGG